MYWRMLACLLAGTLSFCPAAYCDNLTSAGTAASDAEQQKGARSTLAEKTLAKAMWVFQNTQQNHYEHRKGTAEEQVVADNGNRAQGNTKSPLAILRC
jgi:hypothetical protein